MNDIINKALWLVGLVFLQVLLLDKMTLFGVATPLAYIYVLLIWNKGWSRSYLLVVSFILGLVIDMFENMPGVNASACVLLGMLQPVYLNLFIPRELQDEHAIEPSAKTLGWGGFLKFTLFCVVTHHVMVLLLVFFSFGDLAGMVVRIAGCVLMTMAFVIVFELLRNRGNK